jgi:pyridoxine/pyridoxamine 5'-phosphate oxidase
MINDLPLPPKWDGHRVINERYENPNYAINKRKYFDAIVSRDYQAALALDDTPRMIERHLEYNVAEPEFWGYYRALLRTLRWR